MVARYFKAVCEGLGWLWARPEIESTGWIRANTILDTIDVCIANDRMIPAGA